MFIILPSIRVFNIESIDLIYCFYRDPSGIGPKKMWTILKSVPKKTGSTKTGPKERLDREN